MERFATNAETLGYTFCWVADTQMIRSNPGVVLALAAQQTRYLTREVEPGGSSQHEAITARQVGEGLPSLDVPERRHRINLATRCLQCTKQMGMTHYSPPSSHLERKTASITHRHPTGSPLFPTPPATG